MMRFAFVWNAAQRLSFSLMWAGSQSTASAARAATRVPPGVTVLCLRGRGAAETHLGEHGRQERYRARKACYVDFGHLPSLGIGGDQVGP